MLKHTTIKSDESPESTRNIFFLSFENQLSSVLRSTLHEYDLERVHDHVHQGVPNDFEESHSGVLYVPQATFYKDARAKYFNVFKSIKISILPSQQ